MLNRLRHWMVGGLAAAAVGLVLAQPASAVPSHTHDFTHVGVNGEGDALIWPLFDVVNQDTLIAITNTSIEINGVDANAAACVGVGCMGTAAITLNSVGRWSLVHFHVRKPDQSQDARNWQVCLSPGDVWTASMTQSGSDTLIETTDLSTTSVGFPLTAAGITKGYLEAVQVDVGTSEATGCDNTLSVTAHQPGFPSNGIRFANILFGEGLFMGKGTGLASGYNATAIATFQSFNNSDNPTVNSIKSTAVFAGITTPQKRAFFALTHPGLEVTVGSLKSRWFVDSSFGGDTQLVVTFPATTAGTNTLSIRPAEDMAFTGFTNCLECVAFNFNIPATMALWLRDDEENRDGQSPRQVDINKQVNVLTLSSLLAAGKVHLPVPGATGGWLHMMVDNDENEFVDSVTGRTCSTSNPGLSCSATPLSTLTWRFVPRMLDVVGFSIIQAQSTSGDLLSALLPWKWNAPANTYQCDQHDGPQMHLCSGQDIFP